MMVPEDLQRLQSSTQDTIEQLRNKIDMLQKQKKFLQTKLREKVNDTKTKTTTTITKAHYDDKC